MSTPSFASSTNLAKSSCGGLGPVRSGSQFVLPDLFGRVRLALNSSGSTVASAVFDSLGVQRRGSGTLASGVARNAYGTGDEDGLAGFLQSRFHDQRKTCGKLYRECLEGVQERFEKQLQMCDFGASLANANCVANCQYLGILKLIAACHLACAFTAYTGWLTCRAIAEEFREHNRKRCEIAYRNCLIERGKGG